MDDREIKLQELITERERVVILYGAGHINPTVAASLFDDLRLKMKALRDPGQATDKNLPGDTARPAPRIKILPDNIIESDYVCDYCERKQKRPGNCNDCHDFSGFSGRTVQELRIVPK